MQCAFSRLYLCTPATFNLIISSFKGRPFTFNIYQQSQQFRLTLCLLIVDFSGVSRLYSHLPFRFFERTQLTPESKEY